MAENATDFSINLRRQAEEKDLFLPLNAETLSPEQIRERLHELRMHQIELEMKNDELLKTQSDLEIERKRYCDLYDMAPVGYCTLNEKDVIVEANLTAATLFGVERKLLIRRKITLFVHKEDKDIYYLHRKQRFETGELQVCELRMVKQDDGTIFHAHIEGTSAQDEYGVAVWRIVISDISKQKRLQEQLSQAQRMESVARLAGGVAHGFNNMLSVILGHTDMAIENVGLSDSLFDNLMEIRNAAVCSADLTRQLLTFARRQPIAPIPIELNQTIENMLTMLRSLTGGDIEIIWQPGSEIWPVAMDTLQIDQMLARLCVNARNTISGAGKITIETMTATFDQAWCEEHHGCVAGDYVVIAVSDNGRGMDTNTRANIFEPFARTTRAGDYDTKRIGDYSTGLELATVHGIVKQNNGFIKVFSQLGKGTAFTIYLPRYMEDSPQIEQNGQEKPASRGNETVLLVDDEPMVLKMGELVLQSLGYQVISSDNPEGAIHLAEKHAGEFDLLMTDVVMPGMSGTDMAKKILSLYPHVRCLLMSGYRADMLDNNGMLDDGINFIIKPFSRRELADRIREVLIKN